MISEQDVGIEADLRMRGKKFELSIVCDVWPGSGLRLEA
jgi:hypothetical protein